MHDLDALIEPLHDVPDCDRLLREVSDLSPDEVVRETKVRWPRLKRDAWAFALLVERMGRERLYRPYASLGEWAKRELGKESWVVSKHRSAAQYILSLDPDDRRQVMEATPPAVLTEAGIPGLAKMDQKEALRLAKQGLTQQALRQAVRARLTGQKPEESSTYRTFHKVLEEPAYERLQAAWNVTRFLCQTAQPSDSEIAEMLAVEFLGSIQIHPDILARFPLEEIQAGRVKCWDCGSTNPSRLEYHHSHPRSEQGHESPLVTLCMDCHEAITQNRDGRGWREAVKEWMARADMKWFKDAFTTYLAGRPLDRL